MIRMGVSGWMFLLVPPYAYLGIPGSKAAKRLCVRACVCVCCCPRNPQNLCQSFHLKASRQIPELCRVGRCSSEWWGCRCSADRSRTGTSERRTTDQWAHRRSRLAQRPPPVHHSTARARQHSAPAYLHARAHTHPFKRPFVRDYPGEPVPER